MNIRLALINEDEKIDVVLLGNLQRLKITESKCKGKQLSGAKVKLERLLLLNID